MGRYFGIDPGGSVYDILSDKGLNNETGRNDIPR